MDAMEICREVKKGDTFLHSFVDQLFEADFENNELVFINLTDRTKWYIFNHKNLYHDKTVNIKFLNCEGSATQDIYGNIFVKYWANLREEKKNFKFIKLTTPLME